MPSAPRTVVSPADARVITGSLNETTSLGIKDKFFTFEELLGENKSSWLQTFQGGDFALFRLTPDKYHYNHTPVAGRIVDFYQVEGRFHSCNPQAIVSEATPYSKNRRIVTIIDTDVEQGSQVGKVAMIEIVALMIGDIVQCYSEICYDSPKTLRAGMFLKRDARKASIGPAAVRIFYCLKKTVYNLPRICWKTGPDGMFPVASAADLTLLW